MQFALMTVLIMVAGTMFLMWIGDQITERGVGNGVSLIISVNIIHALPGAVTLAWKTLVYKDGAVVPMGAMLLVALIAFLIIVVALVVTVTQAQRRIPVQYAKRVMGNKMFNGATQYLPLKLNYSGVMARHLRHGHPVPSAGALLPDRPLQHHAAVDRHQDE